MGSWSPQFESVHPEFARPLRKESLPHEFQSVLLRLEQRFGANLQVNVTDTNWVEISVENLHPDILLLQLENERKLLFGAAEPRLQVIPPLRPTGNVVYLHLLTEPEWNSRGSIFARGN